jgi:hypothetical protein
MCKKITETTIQQECKFGTVQMMGKISDHQSEGHLVISSLSSETENSHNNRESTSLWSESIPVYGGKSETAIGS